MKIGLTIALIADILLIVYLFYLNFIKHWSLAGVIPLALPMLIAFILVLTLKSLD